MTKKIDLNEYKGSAKARCMKCGKKFVIKPQSVESAPKTETEKALCKKAGVKKLQRWFADCEHCGEKLKIQIMTCAEKECGKEFITALDKEKFDHPAGKDVERWFIDCPHCKRRYPTHYTNKAIRRVQEQIDGLRGSDQLAKDNERMRKTYKRVHGNLDGFETAVMRLAKKKKVWMDNLRQKIERR